MENPGIYQELVVEAVHEELPDFRIIRFKEGHGLQYQAGQYLTLVLFENGSEVRRSYSMVSAPELDEPLTIGVKRVANGVFSRKLVDETRPGDVLLGSGTGGRFILPAEINDQHFIFFAAGSGITPVLSLVKTLVHSGKGSRIRLYYSNSSPERAAFLDELQQLQAESRGRLVTELLFSNHPDLRRARLNRDRILQLLDQMEPAERERTLFYICGPENYMRLCLFTLRSAGIPEENIRKENFYNPLKPVGRAEPPDKETRVAHLQTGSGTFSFSINYPQSILNAARAAGIVLPYSCEAGRCGNCVALCTSGRVWHSYNEVLTAAEMEKGMILTCTGHPWGSDIRIKV